MKREDSSMQYDPQQIKKLLSANYKNDTLFTYIVPENESTLFFYDEQKVGNKKILKELGTVDTNLILNTGNIQFLITEGTTFDYKLLKDYNTDLFDFYNDDRIEYDTAIDYL